MNTIRSFFAIKPPSSIQENLSVILAELKQSVPHHFTRWIDIEHLHITLQFLKSTQSEQVPDIINSMQILLKETPAFQLELGSLEWFPSIAHPKIISLAVGPQEVLTTLSTAIGIELKALNIPIETRAFKGHMTLGRLSPHHNLQKELILDHIKIPPVPPVLIDELFYFESKPARGSNYIPLARFELSTD